MAGRQRPSFKTDVHRAPTKKWVDAKSYSYAGDDWGGYEDEYDAYDDTSAPPIPKTTGLRQPGQALPSSNTDRAAEPSGSSASDTYTAPPPQLHRTGSFEYGDDRRTFSAGGIPPPDQRRSPGTDSSSGNRSVSGYRRPSETAPVISPPHSSTTSNLPRNSQDSTAQPPTLVTDSASSGTAHSSLSQPFQGYDPDPPISQPAYAGSPSSASPGNLFPARKSSLSQLRPARLGHTALDATSTPIAADMSTIEEAREQMAPASTTTPRIVRPADIYKRMEEERERERQSLDSGRPSMESLGRPPRPESVERLRASSGSPGRQSTPLTTVPETKSENRMDGFAVEDPVLARAIGARSPPQPLSGPAEGSSRGVENYTPLIPLTSSLVGTQLPAEVIEEDEEEEAPPRVPAKDVSQASTIDSDTKPFTGPSPVLPQLNRFSGFGSDFWPVSSDDQPADSGETASSEVDAIPSGTRLSFANQPESALQSQPSLGFRSAVQHAFEPSDELSPIRADSQSSMQGSQWSRDGSLSSVSPIMSGVNSASVFDRSGPRDEISAIPATINEEPQEEPASFDSGPGHLRNISAGSNATMITSGFGRSLESHARSESKGRNPSISTSPDLPQAKAASVDIISPGSGPSPSSHYGSNHGGTLTNSTPVDGFSAGGLGRTYTMEMPNLDEDDSEAANTANEATPRPKQDAFPATNVLTTSSQLRTATPDPSERLARPSSRPASPSKSRVKDLATKYDERYDSRSNASPTSSVSSWADSKRSASPSKSIVGEYTTNAVGGSDRQSQEMRPTSTQSGHDLPLLRPQIPGAWISYANSVRSDQQIEVGEDPRALNMPTTPTAIQMTSEATTPKDEMVPDFSPTAKQPSILDDPLTNLQEAGSAIAASLMATVGLSHGATTSESEEADSLEPPEDDEKPDLRDRSAGNIYNHPIGLGEATTSPTSDVAPTPPPKDTPLDEKTSGGSTNNNYFPYFASSTQKRGLSPLRMGSAESAGNNSENDRLHDDIVRSLGVPRDKLLRTSQGSSLVPPSPTSDAYRESIGLPREYDSYWATTAGGGLNSETSSAPASPRLPKQEHTSNHGAEDEGTEGDGVVLTDAPTRPSLGHHRFSWEQESFRNAMKDGANPDAATPITSTSDDNLTERNLASLNLQTGLGSVAGTTTADTLSPATAKNTGRAVNDPNLGVPAEEHIEISPLSTAAETVPYTEGLTESMKTSEDLTQDTGPSRASIPSEAAPISQQQSVAPPKLIPFQEITAMKSYNDRLTAYSQTHNEFYTMETGLSTWLSHMLTLHPEHAVPSAPIPAAPSSTRSKFGITGGTLGGKSSTGQSPQPYYQQYLNSAGSLPQPSSASFPAMPQSQTAAASGSGGAQMHPQGRSTSGQFGTKGMLQSASLGAKGLFAKGKSKLKGGDKVVD